MTKLTLDTILGMDLMIEGNWLFGSRICIIPCDDQNHHDHDCNDGKHCNPTEQPLG